MRDKEIAIQLINVTKKFNNTVAVNNLNLDVYRGEIFVFLGPNGSGKTTTIKLISGLLKPTSGKIYLHGMDVSTHALRVKQMIGLVPDTPLIYPKLTGYEFLELVASIYKIRDLKRIETLLEEFELLDAAEKLIESYSYGMKQKLVFCAALLHEPQILIIDEPFMGLDPKTIRYLIDLFSKLIKENKTIFISTHILELAEKFATRVGIINKGALVSVNTIEELKNKALSDNKLTLLEDIFFELTQPAAES
jgi:ABC-2 type transport system ATP-binding protein